MRNPEGRLKGEQDAVLRGTVPHGGKDGASMKPGKNILRTVLIWLVAVVAYNVIVWLLRWSIRAPLWYRMYSR